MSALDVVLVESRRAGTRHLDGSALSGGVAGPSHLATQNCQLVTEQGDLDVLLVRRRAEPEKVQELANQHQRDRAAHLADCGTSTNLLLRAQILRLHPSGS